MVDSPVPFSELLEFVVDNRGRTCPTAPSGLPLIATNCISNDSLYPTKDTIRYVDQETYENWFRAHPKSGDIIFVLKGAPGRCALVPDPVDFCIAQDMVAIRADRKKIDPGYLFAVLRSRQIQLSIDRMHVGTMIPHFKKGDFNRLLIPLPKRSTQEFIGDAYLALVGKIDKNQKLNETLKATVQAVFKDWFVDFGPTRAKAEGRQPPGISSENAALFPNTLDSTDRPLGWTARALGDVTEQIRRGISPAYASEGTLVLNQKCIRNGQIDISSARRHDETKKATHERQLTVGDILVNSTGVGTLGRAAQVRHLLEPSTFDSHVTMVRANESSVLPVYLGCDLTGRESEIEALGEGSTGQTELSRSRLADLSVLIPPIALQTVFGRFASALFDRHTANEIEAHDLTRIRDLLLPKLISGELQHRDVERTLEEAV